MELFTMSLAGFRRFSKKTTLRTNGKVIALVGPNEAGKSSILHAIASLRDGDALSLDDVARGSEEDDLEIVGSFLLDDDELVAARLTGPRWLRVHKERKGKLTYGFDPPAPDRDILHREAAIDQISLIADDDAFRESAAEKDLGFTTQLSNLAQGLADSGPNLSKAMLSQLKEVVEDLTAYVEHSDVVAAAMDQLHELIGLEEAPSPQRHAIDTLWRLVPDILLFDEDSRSLASSYAIGQLRNEVPMALSALFEIAGMDATALFSAIDSGSTARVATLEHRANAALRVGFREAWRQSGISVALRLSASNVDIQIRNENEDFTSLAERSDGLRQFVALFAFVSINRSRDPILLIDEAEQRLHYDAQADLIQMLTRQRVAAKVIYTTHSAGCLPEDLGHGVRLVHPRDDDPTMSTTTNKFWAVPGGGFSPLLFGLGATTMAFFPTRRAVCVEGAADMLLLPQLLREALGVPTLGYQIVPNLSSAASEMAPILPTQAAAIAFLVDGDRGGRKIGRSLIEAGVSGDLVLILETPEGKGLELEDLIDPDALIAAANAIIDRHHPDAPAFAIAMLPSAMRMQWLEVQYLAAIGQKLPKVELAYELLDMLDRDPARRILSPDRSALLADIAMRLQVALRH